MTVSMSTIVGAKQRERLLAVDAKKLIEDALCHPGYISGGGDMLACAGRIEGHTDLDFPPWSSLYVLRNDGLRIWQRGRTAYRGIPREGQTIVLNIHRLHGAQGRDDQVLVLICGDGYTKTESRRKLAAILQRKGLR